MKATVQVAKTRLFPTPRVALLALIPVVSLLIGVGTVLSLSCSSREARGPDEQLLAGNLQGTSQAVTPKAYFPLIAKNFCPGALERMPWGVQMLGEVNDPVGITLAREAGAHWVRTYLEWTTMEPTNTDPANFNWTTYDQRLANLAAAGLTPIVVIRDNPHWAAEYPCGPINDANLPDFADFLTAVVSRYKGPPYNIKYWELYNEPDNGDPKNYGWLGGCWGNSGAEYAHMLSVAHPTIKAADPEAQVVFGGLAYDWFEDKGGPFVRSFIDGVLSNDGSNYFDLMNFHYYPAFAPRWEDLYDCAGVRGKGVICKAAYLRSKLATFGVNKPFICTEIGQPSGEAGCTEDEQAAYVVQSMVRGASADLQAIIWFTLVDFETEWAYGLLSSDYSPKPSYHAYQTLAQELRGAEYQAPLSFSETGSSQVEGYKFTLPCPDREQWVLWTTDGSNRGVSFPWPSLRWVDKEGNEHYVYDGGAGDLDGSINGRVRIYVGPSPIFAGPSP